MILAALGLSSFLLAVDLAAGPAAAEQASAQKAVDTARSTLARAEASSPGRALAEQRLSEAQAHLAAGRYGEARAKADEAWQLLSSRQGTASFTVRVSESGTAVTNRGKEPISVEGNRGGRPTVLTEGTSTVVPDGQALARVPPPPALVSPAHTQQIKLKPTEKGLGPVTLRWTEVSGAREYEVEYKVENGKPSRLKVQRPEAKLPPLPQGKVLWAVRSVVDEATKSEQSDWRSFNLEPDQVQLEVRNNGWK